MKVLLLRDVKNVGQKGDIKEVSDGFARNFLIPRQWAYIATSGVIAQWQQQKAHEQQKDATQRQLAESLREKLDGASLHISIKVGERGKGFKAIGPTDISQVLKVQGYDISKEKIEFPAVKEPGSYNATIKLDGSGTVVKVKVEVVAQKT